MRDGHIKTYLKAQTFHQNVKDLNRDPHQQTQRNLSVTGDKGDKVYSSGENRWNKLQESSQTQVFLGPRVRLMAGGR